MLANTEAKEHAHMSTVVPPTTVTAQPPPHPKDRSSRSRYRLGMGIAAVGLFAGLAFGITSYQDSQQKIDTFARLPAPGTVTAHVDEPGQQVLYYEGEESVGIDDLAIGIIDPDGATVTIAPFDGELIYETTDLTLGRAIASFDAGQAGAYEIEVSGFDTGQITVGENYTRLAFPGVLAGLALAGLSLVTGLVLWLLAFVKR
jgi:hypothetical protein